MNTGQLAFSAICYFLFVFMQFIAQGSDTDSQQLGGLGTIVGNLVQGLKNQLFFHLLYRTTGFDLETIRRLDAVSG
jgi:hypothetical protein